MALSWTQDRMGPMCRYAEDCAIVMHVIARPDGRDMSVSDIPFNWDAQFDIKKLRVGYIKESFDEITNPIVKQNAQKLLDTLRSLGVSSFIPLTIPENIAGNLGGIGVESAAYFDEMSRTGKMKEARGGPRYSARLIPAVEYLQAQRVRMMMMMKLAEATAGVDVYLVAANSGGGGGAGRGAAGGATPEPPQAGGRGDRGGARGGRGRGGGGNDNQPQGPAQRHSNMANLACYPAINVPNGLSEAGTPTNVTFFARPFGEAPLLALAKAYQDAAGFHKLKPAKLDA
jgi:Asp-tRNA(Asn)/Glu-tRNA(Gln) amidotransferase A subunit family amidase